MKKYINVLVKTISLTNASKGLHYSLLFKGLLFSALLGATYASHAQKVIAQAKQHVTTGEMRARITQAVMQYLDTQTQGYPGEVKIHLQALDPRLQLRSCEHIEPFSLGSHLWGKTHIGVRCRDNDLPKSWTIYVQADIQVFGKYAVVSAPVSQEQILSTHNVVMQRGDLTRLPNNVITDTNLIKGKIANANLAAGTVLRQELLKSTSVIQKGQTVQVTSSGVGFVVSTDGTALNTAQSGQVVQVKVASGQTIRGIAKDTGKVEVVN